MLLHVRHHLETLRPWERQRLSKTFMSVMNTPLHRLQWSPIARIHISDVQYVRRHPYVSLYMWNLRLQQLAWYIQSTGSDVKDGKKLMIALNYWQNGNIYSFTQMLQHLIRKGRAPHHCIMNQRATNRTRQCHSLSCTQLHFSVINRIHQTQG